MRIRTQSALAIFCFGVILVFVVAFEIMTGEWIEKTREQENIANSIVQGASELGYLSHDYVIYREPHQVARWESRFEDFSSSLARLNSKVPEHQVLIRGIQVGKEHLKEVFESVVSAPANATPSGASILDPVVLQVAWSRVSIQTQSIMSDASHLAQLLKVEADQMMRESIIASLSITAVFSAFFFISYLMIQRRTLKGITSLQAGTAIVGSGNLNFIIEEQRRDEIGDLTKAFNRMTADLKAVTASKADLEREIAERKIAEKALAKSEKLARDRESQIRATLEATPAIIWTTLDPECRHISGNRAARELSQVEEGTNMSKTGSEPERLSHYRIYKDGRELAPEEMPVQVVARSGQELRDYSLEFGLEDGPKYSLLGNIVPILDDNGNPGGAIAAFMDVTNLNRLEEELRKSRDELEIRVQERTDELERSNKALQEFASIASHDMKEPLRKVISFGNMLRQKYRDSLEETGNDYLNRMLDATQRMQTLLTSLLEYARVTTHQEPFQEVDLREIINEVLSDLELRIAKSGGEVLVDQLPSIAADPTQMRQLFQNLISNALKFHKDGEKPIVRVGCAASGQANCRITIEDNGIGFEEQYQDKIFSPFHRLHGKDQYEGTGIGLAICKKIVERHGGEIKVRSQLGKGSSFEIRLPSGRLNAM